MENKILVDGKFSTGAVKAPSDKRDRIYDDHVSLCGAIEIDWEKGYDVREELGGDIQIKNQYSSGSCVSQGWSYYIWILQVLEMIKKYGMTLKQLLGNNPLDVQEVSAKAIYSQIFLPNGGAYIYMGGKLVTKWGSVFERLVSSYKNDKTTDEEFMRDISWLNENISKIAGILKGKEYRVIRAKDNMDLFAQAILQNKGVVGGVSGQNGRGWNTERPKPPESKDKIEWGHCLAFLAFGKDEFGKYIATPNSWGRMDWNKDYIWKSGDKPGSGWQKLYTDYFTNDFQFDPWTYSDLINLEENNIMNNFVRVVKDANSSAVGYFLPALSPETIKNMAHIYGKEVPLKTDGSIDWSAFIEGTVDLEKPLET